MPSPAPPPACLFRFWDFMQVFTDERRMASSSRGCTCGGVVKNATRARQYLMRWAKVREKSPHIEARLRRRGAQALANVAAAGKDFALPVAELEQLRLDKVRLMLVSGYSFSTFDLTE